MTQPRTSLIWRYLAVLAHTAATAAQDSSDDDDRSLASALQNINGTSSIFSLIPVLTGKVQNIKAVAGRVFPGALTVAGLGAGRVLSKLQIGVLLMSSDLYRNVVGELSYYHHEYVNTFSPKLIHVPTGTPERHSSNVIVNHNVTEDYMVEAWFRTQGVPAKLELAQTNNRRVFCGLLIYAVIYAFETFLSVKNAATGTGLALIIIQVISGAAWAAALCIVQHVRGQGRRFVHVNRLATADYRVFELVVGGRHVRSALLSTNLANIREYNLFNSRYESSTLKLAGSLMAASGVVDVVATVLVVGLNPWAYGWLGYQVILILIKVFFSLEPIRRVPIVAVHALEDTEPAEKAAGSPETRLPIAVETGPGFAFAEVCVGGNVVAEDGNARAWRSRTPGLWIGQSYHLDRDADAAQTASPSGSPDAPAHDAAPPVPDSPSYVRTAHAPPPPAPSAGSGHVRSPSTASMSSVSSSGPVTVRYLAVQEGKLTLSKTEPVHESNQALQREFLACLAEVVKANKVPSREFLRAVEAMRDGIRKTMTEDWFMFGTNDLAMYLQSAHEDVLWRKFF